MRRVIFGTALGLLVGCGAPTSTDQYSRYQVDEPMPRPPCRACPDPERAVRIADWLKRPDLVQQLQPLVLRAETELAFAKDSVSVDNILDELAEEATLYANTH